MAEAFRSNLPDYGLLDDTDSNPDNIAAMRSEILAIAKELKDEQDGKTESHLNELLPFEIGAFYREVMANYLKEEIGPDRTYWRLMAKAVTQISGGGSNNLGASERSGSGNQPPKFPTNGGVQPKLPFDQEAA